MSDTSKLCTTGATDRMQPTTASVIAPSMSENAPPQARQLVEIKITLACKIDLALLRKQKCALNTIREGVPATYEQEEAAEGLLNLLDLIQDSILEQGLATEEEMFPRLPQLFDSVPFGFDTAA